MQGPVYLVVLLASLLGACVAPSHAVRTEALPVSEKVYVGHADAAEPEEASSQFEVQQASSKDLPEAPAPTGPRGQPLTRERLIALALSQGIGLNPIQVRRNWEVGMAFQFAVCRSLNVDPNFSATDTPGRSAHARGIPDGLLAGIRINVMGQMTFRLVGAFLEVLGPEVSDFLEIKAQQRTITLATGQGQIRGFILALARQRPRRFGLGMPESPRPALLLVTTADTLVSQDVADEAGVNGVAVYHAVVWEDAGLLTVGTFRQRTGFADVLPSFTLPSTPEALSLQRR